MTPQQAGWPYVGAIRELMVGRYFDVSFPDGTGSSGWVIGIQVEGDEMWVNFDWGWSQRLDADSILLETTPNHPPFTFADAVAS